MNRFELTKKRPRFLFRALCLASILCWPGLLSATSSDYQPEIQLAAQTASATDNGTRISVNGLFSGSAVLTINGRQRLLKAGQSSPEGVRLISANTKSALLEVDGQRQRLQLSRIIGSKFVAPERKKVILSKGGKNGYYTPGKINGHSVQMLVDTGATHIAINSRRAGSLGIDYKRDGQTGKVTTASGESPAWFLNVATVAVGGIEVRHVGAVVIEGEFPRDILLGMSYLNHVRLEESGGILTLIDGG